MTDVEQVPVHLSAYVLQGICVLCIEFIRDYDKRTCASKHIQTISLI